MKINKQKLYGVIAENRLSLSRVAEMASISRQTLSTVLGKGSCRPETLGKIAAALGVDIVELIDE